MTIEDMRKAIEEMLKHCTETLISKSEEYARGSTFHNFEVAAELQRRDRKEALIGMMDKHVVSVHDLVRENCSDIDKWIEKIGDNIVYLLLLWAMVKDEFV